MFMQKPGNTWALQLHFAPALFQPDMFLAGLMHFPIPFCSLTEMYQYMRVWNE